MNVYDAPGVRFVIVSVVPVMLCVPPPPPVYDVAPPEDPVNVTVAVVVPVAVAERFVGGFGGVVAAPAVPAVPLPPVPTGVSVNGPYDVFPERLPSVYDVPVIPVTVVNPVPESVNDVAPAPPPHPNVIEVEVFELTAKPVTGAGTVVMAEYVADAVEPFAFTAVSVNGPYVVPPLADKAYGELVIPVIAGTMLYPANV